MLEEKAYVVFSAELQFIMDGLCLQYPDHVKQLEIAFKVEADE
jgi:hypothetical protein